MREPSSGINLIATLLVAPGSVRSSDQETTTPIVPDDLGFEAELPITRNTSGRRASKGTEVTA